MSEEESCPEHQEVAEDTERVTAAVLHESKLEKAFRAVCLNGAILSIGLSVAFISTALPDLQDRTETGFNEITKIFVARGLGFFVGGIFSNYLLRQANQACWITFALVVLAVSMVMVPSCINLKFLMGTLFIQGAACGIIKTGCGYIRQNHFFPADVAWGRMLFVSFGIGTFLAPVLLLPFAGIRTDATSKIIPLHYENVPLHSSTVLTNAVPSRSDLIAPHILARKRRNVKNQTIENITRGEEIGLSQFTSDELSNTSTVKTLDYVGKSTNPGVSLEHERREIDNVIIGLSNTTVDVIFSNESREINPDGNTTVALLTNGSSTVPQLNTTSAAGSGVAMSTMKMPKKPAIANGEILDPHGDVADSSKFRNQIRENLKKPVPDVATPIIPSSTRTSQASAFGTVSLNTSSFAMQNFSSYTLDHLSSTSKVNLSGLQNEQAVPSNPGTGSLRTTTLPLSPLPSSAKWSSSSHLDTGPYASSPSPMLKSSIQVITPGPTVSIKDIILKSSTVFVSSTLQSSVVTLLKSTPAPTRPSILSLETPADALNDTKSVGKSTRLSLLWLSKYGYWIAAFMIGLAATAFAFYWVLCPRVYQARLAFDSEDPARIMNCRFSSVFIATTFHMLYTGLEMSFAILVTSYAVIVLEWSWWLGVLLSLVYWGSFSVGRLVSFVFFSYLRQSVMLFGSLLVCVTVAGSVFISFNPDSSVIFSSSGFAIWLLVGVLGFTMSAILPAGTAEMDKFLPRHSEFFEVVGASIGEMVLPPVIGSIVALYNTVWLAYILLAVFVLCIIISMVVRFLVRSSEVRVSRTSRLLPSSEQDDLEDVLISTNDETELLAKCTYLQTDSPLNGHANGPLPATPSAIQSLMKNISNVKRD